MTTLAPGRVRSAIVGFVRLFDAATATRGTAPDPAAGR